VSIGRGEGGWRAVVLRAVNWTRFQKSRPLSVGTLEPQNLAPSKPWRKARSSTSRRIMVRPSLPVAHLPTSTMCGRNACTSSFVFVARNR
jgi:hypothetical protein